MKKINSLISAFKLFFETGKTKSVLILTFYTIISLIPSILLLLNKKIFESFDSSSFSLRLTISLLLFYLFFQIDMKVLSFGQKLIMSQVRHRIEVEIQKKIQKKMYCISYLEFDNSDTKDLIQRVSGAIPSKSASSVFLFLDIFCVTVQLMTAAVVLLDIHCILPLILILFTLPYIFLYKKMCFDNYFQEVEQGKNHRKNWYLIQMLFSKHFNKELSVYNCFDYLGDKEKKINLQLHNESYSIARKYSFYGMLLDIIKNIGKSICMILTVFLIIFYGVGIAAFTVLVQAMDTMQNCLMSIFSKVKDFSSLYLAFEDYEKFCSIKNEYYTEQKIREKSEENLIELKDVSFSYPSKSNAVHNICLTVKVGEKVAIVGKNGSGKTTLINILLGFYEPEHGSITVYKQNLTDVLHDFRKKTVYIMQSTPRYSMSIQENLSLSKEVVNMEILNVLNINEIIDKAPFKENTLLGEENEDQYNLSGGEWAKLGISRNAQKEDPILFIMDEPTAALDPIIESRIFDSFNKITKDKTTIFVSHRLGMVSLADRIIVLDNGEIVEQGSHSELMTVKGLYYRMFSEQLQLYAREDNECEEFC